MLGEPPLGSLHCQLNLPWPLTVQVKLKLVVKSSAPSDMEEGEATREGDTMGRYAVSKINGNV